MPSQHLEEVPNATPPDERHQDVNVVRRRDFRSHLMSYSRFARSVRQHGGIEKGGQRAVNDCWRAVRETREYRCQNLARLEGYIRIQTENTSRGQFDAAENSCCKPNRILGPGLFREGFDDTHQQCGDMPRDSISCFGVR
jgi:hypothetical protein